MRITCHTFLTLDGVMRGPGAADEDTANGFTDGGWMMPFTDYDFGEIVAGWFARADAVVLGAGTYGLMKRHWSTVTDPDDGIARFFNEGRKYVVSTTMRDADWGDTTILRSLHEVAALTADADGELQVHGSAGLAASLHRAGMIDEYRLMIVPVSVGAGQRLFADGASPHGYDVLCSRTTSAGATYLELRPAHLRAGAVTPEPSLDGVAG